MIPNVAIANDCTWEHPGASRFTGDVPAAVEQYQDIPPEVRARLRQRMEARQYDEMAIITRDDIRGENGYRYGEMRDMHFGDGRICKRVNRKWSAKQVERGLVYCEGENCLIVPTVCSNVARVTRRPSDSIGTIASTGTSPSVGLPTLPSDPGGVTTLPGAAPLTGPLSFATAASIGGGSNPNGPGVPSPFLGLPGQGSTPPSGTFIAVAPPPPPPPVSTVPEPATWNAMVAGLLMGAGLWVARRRQDKRG